nr:hypothetical protein GCM10020092_034050 [Actinoplanes digitatis]
MEVIIGRCARLPLALAIVAARGALHPQFSLEDLATELRDEPGRLDTLATDEASSMVRTVFSWSYRALAPVDAAMFRLFGLHPGPELSLTAAADARPARRHPAGVRRPRGGRPHLAGGPVHPPRAGPRRRRPDPRQAVAPWSTSFSLRRSRR